MVQHIIFFISVTLIFFFLLSGFVQGEEFRSPDSEIEKQERQKFGQEGEGYPANKEGVLEFVETWRQAWQSKKLDTYIDCYARDFRSGGRDLDAYRRHKRKLNKRYEKIRVRIDDLKVTWTEEGAKVSFHEVYDSDQYHDEGRKDLHLVFVDREWKIKKELWTPAESEKKSEAEIKEKMEKVVDKARKPGKISEREVKGEVKTERDRAAESRKRIKKLEQSANHGNIEAQLTLARIYGSDDKGVKDDEQSFFWYREAARQGSIEAQKKVGEMYTRGLGVKQDKNRGAYWSVVAAAREGDSEAQNDLGVMYIKGDGVEKEPAKAVSWLKKAAEKGNSRAQNNLAILYIQGTGVEKDIGRAAFWTRKAAEHGNVEAQNNLAVLYSKGRGVEKDMEKAAFWFEKAAEQGSIRAKKILGLLYLGGEGVDKDVDRAMYWFKQAEQEGDDAEKGSESEQGTSLQQ